MAAEQRTKQRKARDVRSESGKTLRPIAGYLADADSNGLDRLIYEKVRLGIMSALCVSKSLSFSELKNLLKTTDGNLSTHARKLEDAGYLTCKKSFQGRTPRTQYSLTAKGRKAFTRYLDHMEALIHTTREG